MSENTTTTPDAIDATDKTVRTPEEKATLIAQVAEAAADEQQAVTALAAAGWPGRTARAALDAGRAVANAKGRIATKKAEEELATAAAKAAGATGIAGNDRDRVFGAYEGDVAKAAAAAAPTREGTARALVWFLSAIEAAEAEVTAQDA